MSCRSETMNKTNQPSAAVPKRKQQRRRQTKKKVVHVEESNSSSEDEVIVTPSSTPKQKHQKRYVIEEPKSLFDKVYAGPTFNNAPEPSSLPIPAFNSRGSPINYYQKTYELEQTNLVLSEIQRGLRSMLKIESY